MCKGDINRQQPSKNQLGAECVKFQNRPYKASHSEYLQNMVFFIYRCLYTRPFAMRIGNVHPASFVSNHNLIRTLSPVL